MTNQSRYDLGNYDESTFSFLACFFLLWGVAGLIAEIARQLNLASDVEGGFLAASSVDG